MPVPRGGWSPPGVGGGGNGGVPAGARFPALLACSYAMKHRRWLVGLAVLLGALVLAVTVHRLSAAALTDVTSSSSKTALLASKNDSIFINPSITATNRAYKKNDVTWNPLSIKDETVDSKYITRLIKDEQENYVKDAESNTYEIPAVESLSSKYVQPGQDSGNKTVTKDVNRKAMESKLANRFSNPREYPQTSISMSSRGTNPNFRSRGRSRSQNSKGRLRTLNFTATKTESYSQNLDSSSKRGGNRPQKEIQSTEVLNNDNSNANYTLRAAGLNSGPSSKSRNNVADQNKVKAFSMTRNSDLLRTVSPSQAGTEIISTSGAKLHAVFNNSKEILDTLSTELFESGNLQHEEIYRAYSVDFEFVRPGNFSNEKVTIAQRKTAQKFPGRREDVNFPQSPKAQHTNYNSYKPLQNNSGSLVLQDERTYETIDVETNGYRTRNEGRHRKNHQHNGEPNPSKLERETKRNFVTLDEDNRKITRVKVSRRRLGAPSSNSSSYVNERTSFHESMPSSSLPSTEFNVNSNQKFYAHSPKEAVDPAFIDTGNVENVDEVLFLMSEFTGFFDPTTPIGTLTTRRPLMASENYGNNATLPSVRPSSQDAIVTSASPTVLLVGEDFESNKPAPADPRLHNSVSYIKTKSASGRPGVPSQGVLIEPSALEPKAHNNRRQNSHESYLEGDNTIKLNFQGATIFRGVDDDENVSQFSVDFDKTMNLWNTSSEDAGSDSDDIPYTVGHFHGHPRSTLRIDGSGDSFYALTAIIPEGHLHISLINPHKELERSKPIDLSSKYNSPESVHKGTRIFQSISHHENFPPPSESHSSLPESPKIYRNNEMSTASPSQQNVDQNRWPISENSAHEGETVAFVTPPLIRGTFEQKLRSPKESGETFQAFKFQKDIAFAFHPHSVPASPKSYDIQHRTDQESQPKFIKVEELREGQHESPMTAPSQPASRGEFQFDFTTTGIDKISSESTNSIKKLNTDDSMHNVQYVMSEENARGREHVATIDLQNKGSERLQQKSSTARVRPRGQAETIIQSVSPALTADIDYVDSYHKFANRSWPTYDFSFHFHRDLARKSEFRRRLLAKRH